MKQIGIHILAVLLAVCLLVACSSTQAPTPTESIADTSSEPEVSVEPEPEPLPEPEPEPEVSAGDEESLPPERAPEPASSSVPEPAAAPPIPILSITFRIRDDQGNPVAKLSGGVEQNQGRSVSYTPIRVEPGTHAITGADGELMWDLTDLGKLPDPGEYTLILTDTNDYRVTQRVGINIPDREGPLTYDITWTNPHPGDQPPPQTSGFVFTFVDAAGNPVEGIGMGGSPYPIDGEGDINEDAIILGPSDKDGKIHWGSVTTKGTYQLYAHKDEVSESYTFQHPGGEQVVELTYTWSH